MGYSFYIGDMNPKSKKVKRIENENAPMFAGDTLTGKTNGRHPSYGGLFDFCKATDTDDLFNDLIKEHPGIQVLTPKHLEAFTKAKLNWQAKHTLPAGFNDGEDAVLARLIWYEWWVKWALTNCKNPSFQNC